MNYTNLKEFHIISCGTSLLTNIKGKDFKVNNLNEEEKNILIDEIYNELCCDPKKYSAELNAFLKVVENKSPQNIEYFLIGTMTDDCLIVIETLHKYLKHKNYNNNIDFYEYYYAGELSFESNKNSINDNVLNDLQNSFKEKLKKLYDEVKKIVQNKKKQGYKIYFNCTGGLKAQVITLAKVGFDTESIIYYIPESFKRVVFFPNL
ncbi:MAG: hypothetical protein KatS3mg129_2524 [Leptospiraceae bacterium]|nr:MAG: hypothetical protein KatS3mg129_2524 [Leptospiraceae bacterium]